MPEKSSYPASSESSSSYCRVCLSRPERFCCLFESFEGLCSLASFCLKKSFDLMTLNLWMWPVAAWQKSFPERPVRKSLPILWTCRSRSCLLSLWCASGTHWYGRNLVLGIWTWLVRSGCCSTPNRVSRFCVTFYEQLPMKQVAFWAPQPPRVCLFECLCFLVQHRNSSSRGARFCRLSADTVRN